MFVLTATIAAVESAAGQAVIRTLLAFVYVIEVSWRTIFVAQAIAEEVIAKEAVRAILGRKAC